MHEVRHTTVLPKEAVASLEIDSGETVIDATAGAGGHSRAILTALGERGRLLAFDADPKAVERLKAELPSESRGAEVSVIAGNFRNIATLAQEVGIETTDAILADLGWRSEQFGGTPGEGGGKGFSFATDEPLLMTYGDPGAYALTARDIVNDWAEGDIANVLWGYGEERAAKKLARTIAEARSTAPIETTAKLTAIVEATIPRRGRIHPATKTFQALRIAVNDELTALEEFIAAAFALLAPRGRLSIISFHSLEDRIVKQAFRTLEDEGKARRVGKKPVTPTEEEQTENPRARSAKLRTLEKI